MSISNAMQSGVSGLLANSTAVRQIAFNIANANTDGYRRSFASFVSNAVTSPIGGAQTAGVRTSIIHQNTLDGSFRGTGSGTNLAINGAGFFVVTRGPMAAGETQQTLLTRAGSFEPDANGNLRNAAGLYLAGYQYDENGSLGMVDRNSTIGLQTVNVAALSVPGSQTSAVSLSGNLSAEEAGLATPGDPFTSSVEFYSPLGAADRLMFSWQPSTTADNWTVTITDESGNNYGTVDVTFNDSGAAPGTPASYSNVTSTATAPAAFTFDTATGRATLTIDNGTTPQVITVDLGEPGSYDGITQFSGDTALEGDANGIESGTMIRVEIDEKGDVWGFFDNGARRALFNIPLAEVANANGLVTQDNNTFLLSRDSGEMRLVGAATGSAGTVSAGGVESSNVDIAEELTELIQKQRAYSSNAKVITTADEMLDEAMRLKR